MAEEPPDKFKLRASRTAFLTHILKRPTNKPPSIRYEDTTIAYQINTTMAPPNKRFKLFRSRSDDAEDDTADADSPESKIPLLIRFYDPDIRARDVAGRTLDDILAWEDMRLESSHNYIQMLFPLPEGSIFNMQAPVVTREVMEAFLTLPELRARLRTSWERMLHFYGFSVEYPEIPGQNEQESAKDETQESAAKTEVRQDVDEKQVEQKELVDDAGQEAQDHLPEVLVTPPSISTSLKTNCTQSTEPQETSAQINDQTMDSAMEQLLPKVRDSDDITLHDGQNDTAETPESAAPTRQPSKAGMKGLPFSMTIAEPTTNVELPQDDAYAVGIKVVRATHWKPAFRNWAIRFDHNHLRMTRILRCLRVLGLEEECAAFYIALVDVYNDPKININDRTMDYWRRAVEHPLYIAPDGERVGWLRRWCKELEELKRREKLERGERSVAKAGADAPFIGESNIEEQKDDEEMRS